MFVGRLPAARGEREARAAALGGGARALLEAGDLVAHVLGVGADRSHGDVLGVVGEVRLRAESAGAVLGAVARALGLDEARVTAEAGVGLRGYAAEALDQPHNGAVALDEQRVPVQYCK